jgi:hypothetical protein
MINDKLNKKLEEHIDKNFIHVDFTNSKDIIKLDPIRGFDDDIRFTYLYDLPEHGWIFETNADPQDTKEKKILDLHVSELMESEARAIIVWLSKHDESTKKIGQRLTNKALLKMNNESVFITSFKDFKLNEGVESSPAETRLNTFKGGFNHFNKDQMGAMDIFAPRVNSEINRISDEMFDEDGDKYNFGDNEATNDNGSRDENGELKDIEDGYDAEDTGLVINKKDTISTPKRTRNYPYGMDNNPSPAFNLDNQTQSKSNIVFRFADYRGIGNFR